MRRINYALSACNRFAWIRWISLKLKGVKSIFCGMKISCCRMICSLSSLTISVKPELENFWLQRQKKNAPRLLNIISIQFTPQSPPNVGKLMQSLQFPCKPAKSMLRRRHTKECYTMMINSFRWHTRAEFSHFRRAEGWKHRFSPFRLLPPQSAENYATLGGGGRKYECSGRAQTHSHTGRRRL